MGKAVILSACRTAGGKFGGTLSSFEATDLGGIAIAEAVKRSGVSETEIGEVIMGNGWQAGVGANPARIAMYKAGLPQNIPAFTVNKRCGSGLKAVMLVADKIRLGDINLGVAGGMESASKVPYILPEARWGHRMGDKTTLDVLHKDGFMCPIAGMLMGATAEILVDEYSISREEQDAFALGSHKKAIWAIKNGLFKEEIVPINIKKKKETIVFDTDEIPREDTNMEKLGRLPAIFREGGTVTAGTSSALCDAGSALVVADEEWARSRGYEPLAEIVSYASGALEADHMGLGPTVAVPKALDKAGLSLDDIDLIELNEAFAAQVIAVQRVMPFDMEKCNVHGGAIALGHPIGATGAKILTTLIYALKNHDKELGLATACIGGGQGVAMVVRRLI
ncbi:MAG: acetyl-CoA C-acetyltransferase [Thermovirga sp.]|jgi:acetyl-CoA C-acetyltransferase|nr:acetyl-CoA C-acetyltransferase [Thermovirga sp.]MDN5368262.1 acetyl-CoA C-acetyltransferase [Thermovirga sp.]